MEIISAILIGILSGIVAFVYVNLLSMDPDMIFGKVYGAAGAIAARWPWTEWVLKPIILCDTCVAGQIGLWAYVYVAYTELGHYDIVANIVCISISIFTHYLISKNR
jgi:hypothetical protein